MSSPPRRSRRTPPPAAPWRSGAAGGSPGPAAGSRRYRSLGAIGSFRHHRWEHHDADLPVDPDLAPDDPGEPSPRHHPGPHLPRSRQHGVLGAIALGGFAGTLARYGVELAWPAAGGGFPWATFVINTSGALILGVALTVILERFRRDRFVRPFLCVGVLGSWTTMSSLAVESDLLVRHGRPGVAVGYVAATVVAGLAVTWSGIGIGRSLAAGRLQWSSP